MKPTVAAFDFDGTLTYSDTLIPFFRSTFGNLKTAKGLLKLLPRLSTYFIGNVSRQQAKELILTHFLKDLPYNEVESFGKVFAEGTLESLLNVKAMDKFKWHKSQGHTCVLISANLSFYLFPWAQNAGFDHAITSCAAINEKGRITGKLEGLNCYGPEKVKRLKELMGDKSNYTLYAYGDSQGDAELLNYADFPFYRKIENPLVI